MPPRFGFGNSDVWIPERPEARRCEAQYDSRHRWFLMGDLKPGLTKEKQQIDLDIVAHQLATKYPKEYPKHFSVEFKRSRIVVGQFERRSTSCWRRSDCCC